MTNSDIYKLLSRQQQTVINAIIGQVTSEPNTSASKTNCPNCGAPITGHSCEYCGTVHDISDRYAEIERLKLETRKIEEQDAMKKIYYEAIASMSKYR